MATQIARAVRIPAMLVSAVLLMMVVAASSASAGGPAGILLYFHDGDNVFLLLANDSKVGRGWSGFGGGAKPGESPRVTAARETEEETRGYFSRAWLEVQISEQDPLRSRGFSMYFVEVPFVPAQRVMNNHIERHRAPMLEFQCYAWIPFSELEPVLSKENPSEEELRVNLLYVAKGCEPHSYWRVWIRTMHDAQKQGAFPWSRGTKTERAASADANTRR